MHTTDTPNSANNRPATQGHSIVAETKPRRLKLGIDVHWSQYTVVAQFDGASPRPAQRFTPQAFLAWVATKLQAGKGRARGGTLFIDFGHESRAVNEGDSGTARGGEGKRLGVGVR